MRSRYSAYVALDADHLQSSWDPATRPLMVTLVGETQWQGLTVLDVVDGGPFDDEGVVEFMAAYRQGRNHGVVHERSKFRRADGRWLYISAVEEA